MTTRRGFLAGILAAGFAPAAIGSGVLMPVRKIAAPEVSGMALLLQAEQEALTGIHREMLDLAAERMALIREMVRYGVIRAGNTGDTLIYRRWEFDKDARHLVTRDEPVRFITSPAL